MTRLLFLLFILVFATGATVAETNEIAYSFDFRSGSSPAVDVTVTFKGEDDGETFVSLPGEWGGQERLFETLTGFWCLNDGCEVTPTNVPTAILVKHQPGETVSVIYTVRQDWDGPVMRSNYYRPILTRDYVHMIGHAMIAVPDNYKDQPVSMTIAWHTLPEDWAAITSFGEGHNVSADLADISELQSALYVAGDFDIRTFDINGSALNVAVRGSWQFSIDEFYGLAEKVVRSQRDFWNDYAQPFFLITLIPTAEQCCSFGGTGLTNTFAMFVSNGSPDTGRFKYLLSHEFFHNWLGTTIRQVEPEEHMYWFTEGFTDYYSALLNLRAGIVTLEEFASGYNKVIENYFLSPARNSTVEEVREGYWQNDFVQKIPYQQGNILAHNWNSMVRAQNRDASLDDVMKDVLAAARSGNPEFDAPRVDDFFRGVMTGGILGEVMSHVTNGETIYPRNGALGPCFIVEDQEKIPFDIGFEYEPSDGEGVYWVITRVKPGSAAEQAGLKAGMDVSGYSFYWGDIENPVQFWIGTGENTRKFSYLAKGTPTFVPQYVLDEERYAADPEACTAWFLWN